MAQISEPAITYMPRSDATPQGELNALKAIYRRAIERFEEVNEGGPATAPDDRKGPKHDPAKVSISQ
jgi:hypothetical protein